MSLNIGRELLGATQDAIQEFVREQIDDETLRIQAMDITRAAAALLDANVEEETIKGLLCRYWNLRLSEAYRFIRDGEKERKIQ